MTVLRATLLVAAVVAATVLPASTAVAQVHAVSITSPQGGAELGSSTPLEVTVRWSGQRPGHVDLRLLDHDGSQLSGSETVRLSDCRGNCNDFAFDRQDARFTGATLRPATLAPFASGGGPRCNGAYSLQVRPPGGDWQGRTGFVASVPPGAPGDVAVSATTGRATVSWSPAPQPDVVGYTVQRRAGSSGSWSTVTEVGPQTTEVTDRDAPSGSVSYRVTTFRGDGADGQGQPMPACSDTGRDLATAASPVSTTVPAPSPTDDADEPTDGGSTGGGDGTEGDGGGTDGDGATPDDDQTGASGGDDQTGASGDDEEEAAPQPSPRRRAPSNSVESGGSRNDVDVPDVASPTRSEGERFYGEDDPFSEQLDFGEDGTATADDRDVAGEVTLGVPGGLQGTGGQQLQLRRVLVPVAGGMILLSFGLHLRRWIHAPAE